MECNEVLRGLRIKNTYTQKKVAEILNLTQRGYAHYEKGDRQPSIDILKKLSELYNVPVDVLIGKYELPELKEIINQDKPKRGRKPTKSGNIC